MRAILLCAGYATRMYPFTRDFPKPLLRVAGKPVIDYFMDQLIVLPKLREIHLVTNARFFHHFEKWGQKWQSDLGNRGINLFLHNDGTTHHENRLGAVADLNMVLKKFTRQRPSLVAAGDNIFRFSLAPIWQQFLQNGKTYVIAIAEHDAAKLRRTGILELNSDGRVLRLHEKPEKPPSTWTCPAIYFFQPEALSEVEPYLALHHAQDAPGYFLAYLVKKKPVFAIKVAGSRFDIGSVAEYQEAIKALKQEPVLLDSFGDLSI